MIFSQILPFSDADLLTEVTLDDDKVITNMFFVLDLSTSEILAFP